MSFINLRISNKYPLIIVTLALFAALVTGLVAYNQSSRQMRAEAERKLVALLESRKAALDSYFTSIREDLRFQARSKIAIQRGLLQLNRFPQDFGPQTLNVRFGG